MFVVIFLLAILNTAESQCISLEQNSVNSIQCLNMQQLQQTISFTQEFCEPPKIIIRRVSYSNCILSFNQCYLQNSNINYNLQINEIITDFQFQLQCNTPGTNVSFLFYWAALIEDRILVFNDFIESIPLIDGYRTRLIPYPLQNTDYEISYSIISYSGGNPSIIIEKQATGFNLYVTEVSCTQLSGLGVQLVAGFKYLYSLFDSISVQQCGVETQYPKMSDSHVQCSRIFKDDSRRQLLNEFAQQSVELSFQFFQFSQFFSLYLITPNEFSITFSFLGRTDCSFYHEKSQILQLIYFFNINYLSPSWVKGAESLFSYIFFLKHQ